MAVCCKRKTKINSKFAILTIGVLVAAALGSVIGNKVSTPSDQKMEELAETLSSATTTLTDSVNMIVPVVDTVDGNVKALSLKVDAYSKNDAIEIHGMETLMATVKGIDQKVDSLAMGHKKLSSEHKGLETDHQNITTRISKIQFSKAAFYNTKDGSKLESFDPSKARRVLCFNRTGDVKCLPNNEAKSPVIRTGFVKECIVYAADLHCGISKKFN